MQVRFLPGRRGYGVKFLSRAWAMARPPLTEPKGDVGQAGGEALDAGSSRHPTGCPVEPVQSDDWMTRQFLLRRRQKFNTQSLYSFLSRKLWTTWVKKAKIGDKIVIKQF